MIVIRNKRAYMASSVCDDLSCRGPQRSFPNLSPQESRQQVRRQWEFKRKYGLTLEQHHQMYFDRGGRCAICGETVAYDKIDTDHNHKTGKMRGLLCGNCNRMLGGARDNPETLQRAVEYLKIGVGR